MKVWKWQKAEADFCEVFEAALREGPQAVTRRGETAVVVLSYATFVELTRRSTSLDEVLAGAPRELLAERDPTPVPGVTLE